MILPGWTVLIIDDCEEDRVALQRFLLHDPSANFTCITASTAAEGIARSRVERLDAILLDYELPDKDGLSTLSALLDELGRHAIAIVMLTGAGSEMLAVEAMKVGAQDYLVKDFHLRHRLGPSVAAAITKVGLIRQVEQQRDALEESHHQLEQALAAQREVERALMKERSLLAQRVEERTAELRAMNIELARADRLKDEFLAGMSHELRTPLNAILGLSESLRERIYGGLSDRQDHVLGLIEESGRHLLELIGDILDLAKIGAGKLELGLELLDVAELCQASLRMVHQPTQERQLTVELSLDPLARQVYADDRRLKQILVNLLSNAVKFTPPGGRIGLEVVAQATTSTIAFTVWDSGIGIAQEDLASLFQPFVQLDGRLARQYEGTGLGLALVQRMTDLHHGTVDVSSQPGAGSRFTVSLPWSAET